MPRITSSTVSNADAQKESTELVRQGKLWISQYWPPLYRHDK
jgi:hypothetical protein